MGVRDEQTHFSTCVQAASIDDAQDRVQLARDRPRLIGGWRFVVTSLSELSYQRVRLARLRISSSARPPLLTGVKRTISPSGVVRSIAGK